MIFMKIWLYSGYIDGRSEEDSLCDHIGGSSCNDPNTVAETNTSEIRMVVVAVARRIVLINF